MFTVLYNIKYHYGWLYAEIVVIFHSNCLFFCENIDIFVHSAPQRRKTSKLKFKGCYSAILLIRTGRAEVNLYVTPQLKKGPRYKEKHEDCHSLGEEKVNFL